MKIQTLFLLLILLGTYSCKKDNRRKHEAKKPQPAEQETPIKPEEVDTVQELNTYTRQLAAKLEETSNYSQSYTNGRTKAEEDCYNQYLAVKNQSQYEIEFVKRMVNLIQTIDKSSQDKDYKAGYYSGVGENSNVSIYKPTSISGLDSLLSLYIKKRPDISTTSSAYESGEKAGKEAVSEEWERYKDQSSPEDKFTEKMLEIIDNIFQGTKDHDYQVGFFSSVSDNFEITRKTEEDEEQEQREKDIAQIKTTSELEGFTKKLRDKITDIKTDDEEYQKAYKLSIESINKLWESTKDDTTNRTEVFTQLVAKEIEKAYQSSEDSNYKAGFYDGAILQVKEKTKATTEVTAIPPESINYGQWSKNQFDATITNCLKAALETGPNLLLTTATNRCVCFFQEAAKRWDYDSFIANEQNYTDQLVSAGYVQQCANSYP